MTTPKTPKKPTAPSVATLTKKLKAADAEIAQLKESILKLTDYTAEYGNGQYTLGYDDGYKAAQQDSAMTKADAGIARFFRR